VPVREGPKDADVKAVIILSELCADEEEGELELGFCSDGQG
jgi:hypothetical protein